MARRDTAKLEEARLHAIIAALAANIALIGVKAVSAYLSNSAAVFTSVLQSISDSMVSVFVLIGYYSARKPPDERHPYGYGKDAYFWSLVAALVMLGIIASAAIREGIQEVLVPDPDRNISLAVSVLGVALAIEAAAVGVAVRGLRADALVAGLPPLGVFRTMLNFRRAESPAVKIVFVEDFMGFTGVLVTMVALSLSAIPGLGLLDGFGAIIIGSTLGILALVMAVEYRSKLIGVAADRRIDLAIRRVALADPPIRDVADLTTMVVGPGRILAHLTVELDPKTSVTKAADITMALRRKIVREVRGISECYIEVIADEDPDYPG